MEKIVCISYIMLHVVALLMIFYLDIVLEKPKNKVHFYVVRDKIGDLWLYIGKPVRGKTEFRCGHDKKAFCLTNDIDRFGLKYKDFDSLKWENEPVEVFLNLEDNMKQGDKDLLLKDSCTIKDCEHNEPETISEIVLHPEKFNPKTQPCVLTNQGIITDIVKFD